MDERKPFNVLSRASGKAGIPIPKWLQGHTFGGNGSDSDDLEGHFRIVYILCSDFMIYLDDSDFHRFNPSEGFSNIKLAGKMQGKEKVTMPYQNMSDKSRRYNATIMLEADDKYGYLKRLEVTDLPEKIEEAIVVANYCVSNILDSISFSKRTPIQIRDVIVYMEDSQKVVRKYFTLPYYLLDIEEESDITTAYEMPEKLRSLLRLFREAVNSTSPHYRLLCLYRILEGLKKIQSDNAKIIKSRGEATKRKPFLMPDNPITQHYFPNLVGKRIGSFYDYVYHEYRIPTAHLNWDEYNRVLLDPAHLKTDQRIEVINCVLISIVPEIIKEEFEFMGKNNLN